MADGLATANATIGSVATAEADVADVRQRVEDLNLEQLQPGTLAVGSFDLHTCCAAPLSLLCVPALPRDNALLLLAAVLWHQGDGGLASVMLSPCHMDAPPVATVYHCAAD